MDGSSADRAGRFGHEVQGSVGFDERLVELLREGCDLLTGRGVVGVPAGGVAPVCHGEGSPSHRDESGIAQAALVAKAS